MIGLNSSLGKAAIEHYYIGIAAVSEIPSSRLSDIAKEFVETLSPYKEKIKFVLGGYWGLMKTIAINALNHGFHVIFILPEEPAEEPPRRKNSTIIRTELGYKTRSIILVKTSDILVCLGGRIGSIIEVMLAYSFEKPTIIVKNTGLDTDNLVKAFPTTIDERRLAKLYYVENGVEAARKILELINIVGPTLSHKSFTGTG